VAKTQQSAKTQQGAKAQDGALPAGMVTANFGDVEIELPAGTPFTNESGQLVFRLQNFSGEIRLRHQVQHVIAAGAVDDPRRVSVVGGSGKRAKDGTTPSPQHADASSARCPNGADGHAPLKKKPRGEDQGEGSLAKSVTFAAGNVPAASDGHPWRWRRLGGSPSDRPPIPRWGHTATKVGGKIMVLGGENTEGCLDCGHVLDPTSGIWTPVPVQGPFGHRTWMCAPSLICSPESHRPPEFHPHKWLVS
jgi:hypothetical protein